MDLFIKWLLREQRRDQGLLLTSGTHSTFPGSVEAEYKIIPGNSSVLREQMVLEKLKEDLLVVWT